MTAVVTSPSQLPDNEGSNGPEKVNVWTKGLKEALERATREEPKVRTSEIVEHLRLITGNEDKPVIIWQKEERGSLTLAFERKGDLLKLLEDRDFLEALGNAETYVALGIVKLEELKDNDFELNERLRAWVSYNKRHSNEDVKEFNVLVLDLDYKGKFEEESLEKLAEFLAFLEENDIDFNFAFSGGGFHLYVTLLNPVKPNDWRKYQERFIALGKEFGLPADERIKDPARVMRLIGTINWKYEWPKPTFWIKDGALPVSTSVIEEVLPPLDTIRGSKNGIAVKGRHQPLRRLDNTRILELVQIVKPFYKPGHRHEIVKDLLGVMIKAGIEKESARRVIELLAEDDEEKSERLYQVDYHYEKRQGVNLCGLKCLREELLKIKKEDGLDDEEAAKQVGEVLNTIKRILGIARGSGVAWLRRRQGKAVRSVTTGREGVYVINNQGEARLITSAIPKEVKLIKILPEGLPLNLGLYYSVRLEVKGKELELVGTLEDVANNLKQLSFLDDKEAFKRLIEEMAEEEVETWYAVGPWLVEGKLLLARETGYRPRWRFVHKWEPELEGDIELGLEVVRRFVEGYKDHEVPAFALSFYPALALAYEIRKELSYLPHLVIEGKRGGGKSTIAEFLALLNNVEPDAALPRTEYETQKALAQAKLLLVLDEAHNMDERALKELHRAATNVVMAEKSGPTVQGVYLNLRGVVMTANEGLRIGLDSEDKFVRLYLSAEYGIDVEKARGFTPDSMDLERIKAVKTVGLKVLEKFAKLFEERKRELKGLPRRRKVLELLELGYQAWRELYEEYGLEPFPKPDFEGLTESAVGRESFDYRQAFYSFIRRVLDKEIKELELYVYDKEALDWPTGIQGYPPSCVAFEENGAVMFVEGNDVCLFANKNFFEEVNNWIRKRYGENVALLSVTRWLEELGALKKRREQRSKVKLCGSIKKGYKVKLDLEPTSLFIISLKLKEEEVGAEELAELLN
ncbi:hypothetical protein IPA_02755 [Ignicoccus pacificus DSM 13166]|uniref:Uncharacterized protein n=1 Tax=Ignicoccus pacificus DSM 13166 TaxID=940294 RepID=A0A977PL84_9CREN|nr:hypothetical protein IPA_02755 [Ignicoccus pacificus DSM 13166]